MKKISLVVFIILFAMGFCLLSVLLSSSNGKTDEVILRVPEGAGAAAIGRSLADKHLVRSYINFRLASFVLGAETKMQAGTYRLSSSMPLYRIVFMLKNGETSWEPVKMTFPEGTSIYKMGALMEQGGIPCGREFKDLAARANVPYFAKDFPFLQDVAIDSLEGYLYPDTYVFARDVTAEVLADLMLTRFAEVVIPFWIEQGAGHTGYSLHQILTLASIIEKEAQMPEERPVISSVFHNRLEAGMPLGADPTIKYALENPTKKVYYNQLRIDSPYNTYKRAGLPPGPICNPGIESIKAAVYPAKTDYYFFVANEDGSHTFTRTSAEHIRAKKSTPTR
ncbi:MAG: endolytic transglycosylase MltG [Candidatus Margulisiibacteriota bacterium]